MSIRNDFDAIIWRPIIWCKMTGEFRHLYVAGFPAPIAFANGASGRKQRNAPCLIRSYQRC